MRKMKALVKKNAEPGLWLDEVPIPKVGINDVLIKVHKTSICGTDFHIYNWDQWTQKTIPIPLVIGHEFVGIIEGVGSNVHDISPSGAVSGEERRVCGCCRNLPCRASTSMYKDKRCQCKSGRCFCRIFIYIQ